MNVVIYLPSLSGEASINLAVKSNATELKVIKVTGHSGVGRLQLISLHNTSPLIIGNKPSSLYEETVASYLSANTIIFLIRSADIR